MREFVPPFDLTFLEDASHLARLVEGELDAHVVTLSKVGQGFYAQVYRADLDRDPGRAIVKCHKYAGRGAREKEQLEVLGQHALVTVPQVYALHLASEAFPCEALIMEHVPGLNASKVQFPDERTQARFVDVVIENLRAWHAVHNTAGFGELGGPFYGTWQACLGRRIALYHGRIHADAHGAIVSPHVMGIIDRSFEATDAIFERAGDRASLVHSDYNAWNMMVDPETYALTGVIDPIDAGWADPEIDLFHLANCRPELGLLERYLEGRDLDERFWLRYRFYRFWDDVKHYLRMGWYSEERFRGYGDELASAMDECLG